MLTFDETSKVSLLQFSDPADAQQFHRALSVPKKQLELFQTEGGQKQVTMRTIDQPQTSAQQEAIVSEQLALQTQNKQIGDVVRQAYRVFLTSAPDSADIYLALASLQQQAQQGLLLENYKDELIRKLLTIMLQATGSVVNSRCLKLFQFFCEQDSALVEQLLQNNKRWIVEGKCFLEILYVILVKRCVSVTKQKTICNEELVYSVCSLLAKMLQSEAVITPHPQHQQNLQNLINVLSGLVVYQTDPKQQLVAQFQSGTVHIEQLVLKRQLEAQSKPDVCLELLILLHRISSVAARLGISVQFPVLNSQELGLFVNELLHQLDIEFCCFVSAFQQGKVLQYYAESGYGENFKVVFNLCQFIILEVQGKIQNAVVVQKVLLNQQKLLQILKYLNFIASSNAFFMDSDEQVQNESKINFAKLENLVQNFLILLTRLKGFLGNSDTIHNKTAQDYQLLEFSCIINIAMKVVICLKTTKRNIFSSSFVNEEGSVIKIINTGIQDFQLFLQKANELLPKEEFIIELFSIIKLLLNHINSPGDARSHLSDDQTQSLLGFCVKIFSNFVNILALTLQKDGQSVMNYFSIGVIDIICQCVKFSVTDMCSFYFSKIDKINEFHNNLLGLFEGVIVTKISDFNQFAGDKHEQPVRIMQVLTMLLDYQQKLISKQDPIFITKIVTFYNSVIINILPKQLLHNQIDEQIILFLLKIMDFALKSEYANNLKFIIISTILRAVFELSHNEYIQKKKVIALLQSHISIKNIIFLTNQLFQILAEKSSQEFNNENCQEILSYSFQAFINFAQIDEDFSMLIPELEDTSSELNELLLLSLQHITQHDNMSNFNNLTQNFVAKLCYLFYYDGASYDDVNSLSISQSYTDIKNDTEYLNIQSKALSKIDEPCKNYNSVLDSTFGALIIHYYKNRQDNYQLSLIALLLLSQKLRNDYLQNKNNSSRTLLLNLIDDQLLLELLQQLSSKDLTKQEKSVLMRIITYVADVKDIFKQNDFCTAIAELIFVSLTSDLLFNDAFVTIYKMIYIRCGEDQNWLYQGILTVIIKHSLMQIKIGKQTTMLFYIFNSINMMQAAPDFTKILLQNDSMLNNIVITANQFILQADGDNDDEIELSKLMTSLIITQFHRVSTICQSMEEEKVIKAAKNSILTNQKGQYPIQSYLSGVLKNQNIIQLFSPSSIYGQILMILETFVAISQVSQQFYLDLMQNQSDLFYLLFIFTNISVFDNNYSYVGVFKYLCKSVQEAIKQKQKASAKQVQQFGSLLLGFIHSLIAGVDINYIEQFVNREPIVFQIVLNVLKSQVVTNQASDIVLTFLKSNLMKKLFIQNHYDAVCADLEGALAQNQYDMVSILIIILLQASQSTEKIQMARNASLVASIAKISLLLQNKIKSEYIVNAIQILSNLVSDESVPILIIDNFNLGVQGIPVVKVCLNYLSLTLSGRISLNKQILEIILMILHNILSYKGPKKDQVTSLIKPFIPECYQLCKELAVMPGCATLAESTIQIVGVIERL